MPFRLPLILQDSKGNVKEMKEEKEGDFDEKFGSKSEFSICIIYRLFIRQG
jgi:hypothetical protein